MGWSDFNQFSEIIDRYMPVNGEGDTMATQAVTAVNKLVYKWFNDGDVYDNQYGMEGWANDLSSYANWLYKYVPASKNILELIYNCRNDGEYEAILFQLADTLLNDDVLYPLDQQDKASSIYECDGPFAFVEQWEEDEYDEWDDEGEEDYDDEDF